MADVLDWRTAADPREVIHRAAQALAGGGVVAFPTEAGYGLAASALLPEAVEQLCQGARQAGGQPLPLALGGADEALDWVPHMGRVGRRLVRRCWPGPVTLVFGNGVEAGLLSRLPEAVRQRVCPAGSLSLCAPAHPSIQRAMRLLPGPLAVAGPASGGELATAEQVVQAAGETLSLVIADHAGQAGQPATVVRVDGEQWQMIREGLVSEARLRQQTACAVLFVCTGNTCRSPLAEALCKKLLAERLRCAVEELPQRGFLVLSAGLAAMMGGGAADEAVEVARELGADLSGHYSRPLTPELAAQVDYLFAMTRGHLLALADQGGRGGPTPRLLSPEGQDIPDPIGCDRQVYQDCAREMLRCLEHVVAELVPNPAAPSSNPS